MKGKFGKKTFSLKKTPAMGITIYGLMGRMNTNPIRTRINSYHGITSHVTREMEEKRNEYQHKRH